MSAFSQLHSFVRLTTLSENPIDLTLDAVLTPNRIKEMTLENCNWKLLYATERVGTKTIDALIDLAKEAKVLDKMREMQEGEVINSIEGFASENRSVLHTAMRDFFDNPIKIEPAEKAADLAKKEVEKLQAFTEKTQDHFTDIIQIGIGGSDLGPQALYYALKAYQKPNRRVFFLSNVDPDNAAEILSQVDLSKTLVICVSKSGTTLETLTNEALVKEAFLEKKIDPSKHMVAVTGKGSPMDDSSKYLESFYIWDYVGGRFSASSMVGGVLLSIVFGFDAYLEFLRGANAMDKAALNEDCSSNLPLMGALLSIWNRNFLHYSSLAVIPYSHALSRFPAHLQQCEMESNGKRIDKKGKEVDFETSPIIWGEPGTNGQHSFFQMLHQGTTIVPVEFIGFEKSQYEKDSVIKNTTSQQKLLSNLFAQSIALATGKKDDNPNKVFPGNRPNHILLNEKLTPYSLGALLSYYEHKFAFEGFIWNINSFDQEGVQLGKVLANKVIAIFAKDKDADFELGKAYLDLLS